MRKRLSFDILLVLLLVLCFILSVLYKVFSFSLNNNNFPKCIPCHKINYYSHFSKVKSNVATEEYQTVKALQNNIGNGNECNIIFEYSDNNNFCSFENNIVKCFSNKDIIRDDDIYSLIINSESIPFVLEINSSVINSGILGCKSVNEMIVITNSDHSQNYDYWNQIHPKIKQKYDAFYEEKLQYLDLTEILSFIVPLVLPIIMTILKEMKKNT